MIAVLVGIADLGMYEQEQNFDRVDALAEATSVNALERVVRALPRSEANYLTLKGRDGVFTIHYLRSRCKDFVIDRANDRGAHYLRDLDAKRRRHIGVDESRRRLLTALRKQIVDRHPSDRSMPPHVDF